MLIKMNNYEREKWYMSKGFTSAEQMLLCAEEELELIKTIEDIYSYKQKYSKYFIFENNEVETNINPYLKIGKFGYSYVCNINGDVIINNEICNYNDLTSYEETSDYKNNNIPITRSAPTNKISIQNGSRKFWAEVKLIGDDVYIEFYARKRTGWWNDYKTTYTITHHSHTTVEPDSTNKNPQYPWVYVDKKNPNTFGLLWLIGQREINDGPKYSWTTQEYKGRYTMFFDRRSPKILSPDSTFYPNAQAFIHVSCRSGLNSNMYVKPNEL